MIYFETSKHTLFHPIAIKKGPDKRKLRMGEDSVLLNTVTNNLQLLTKQYYKKIHPPQIQETQVIACNY